MRLPTSFYPVLLVCLTGLCMGHANATLTGSVDMNPAHIPFKPASSADDHLVWRAIIAFLISGGALYGLALLVRRYLQAGGKLPGQSQQMQKLEIMRLNARSSLIRIRWGQEELLIGENEHTLTLLDKRPVQEASPDQHQTVMPGGHHVQK